MKFFLSALLSLLLLGTLAPAAHATSNRGVALHALATHSATYKKLQRATLSPQFVSGWEEEAACINEIFDGIDSSAMGEEDKSGYTLAVYVLATVDYTVGASRDWQKASRVVAGNLVRKSKRLLRRSESKRGKVIARSLRGHAQTVRFFLQGKTLDFCVVRNALGSTYTVDSIEEAFALVITPEFEDWLQNTSQGTDSVDRGVAAMKRVRPRISARRINKYASAVSFGLSDAFPVKSKGARSGISSSDISSSDIKQALHIIG